MLQSHAEQVGCYVVTPLIQAVGLRRFAAAVSIRRGKYDRVFRFIPQFADASLATSYAMAQGRSLLFSKQLN
ncbi:hypothetical protein [Delftia sp. PS-11]|uniref:hypothetical protein n=1 Tax=Delftia sp. PS-11 TaxID=2767222 RepID=UPI002457CB1E|nr:hypothetical protein [Delftia sp. PS-11]KAJ8738190.1 hypothetical protein H9T68_24005 [Delftia sp. PS-11]